MANNDNQVSTIRGKASFAKVLGDPTLNYSKDGKEWKFDIVIDNDTVKEIKALGIGDRVKTKDNYVDGRPHLTFKQPEFRRDGTPNKPIDVKDILQQPWPQDKLIGNESDIEVKFVVRDYGVGKKKGAYVRSIRVLKLVPYAGADEFEDITEDDPFYEEALKAAKAAEEASMVNAVDTTNDVDLDDDIDDIAV